MRYRLALLTAILLSICIVFSSPEARAHDIPAEDHHHGGQDEVQGEEGARRALENGEILSLDRVITLLRGAVPGEISSVELEKVKGVWIYEFRVISPDGWMIEVYIDAKTGQLIRKAGE